MNLYLKQKMFSLRDKFSVFDENETVLYTVEGKVVSLHNRHSIFNSAGEEVANIHKHLMSVMPKFFIEKPVGQTHEMKGKLAFAHDVSVISDLGWEIKGKFLDHDYTITKDDQVLATVHEKWLSWGDAYEISIADGVDEVMVLAAILCIDIMHEQDAEVSTAGTVGMAVNLSNDK